MSLSEISNSTEHEDREFSDLNLTQADLSGYSFENCIFSRCNLSGATPAKVRFISCSFIFCDLSNVVLKNARIRDSAFKTSKLIGIQWVQLDDFVNPSFDECNLNYCNFVGLKLKKTKFFKCSLKETDFSQSDLAESSFLESDLCETRFNETNLIKSDFRGAVNYTINPIGNKIRGARFSLPEAQGLLVGLGIIIE